jgi:hypothetical protein
VTTRRAARGMKAQAAADAEQFRRALEVETKASLRRDPSRWAWKRSSDPDHARAKPRRQPWRAEP